MINSNRQLVQLTGFALFEIFLQVIGALVFSVLLCLKVELQISSSWWIVFSPLYAADALHLYFSGIVYIRSVFKGKTKEANRRLFWVFFILALYFIFKMLVCHHLQGTLNSRKSYLMAPIFTLWILLLVRKCRQS